MPLCDKGVGTTQRDVKVIHCMSNISIFIPEQEILLPLEPNSVFSHPSFAKTNTHPLIPTCNPVNKQLQIVSCYIKC